MLWGQKAREDWITMGDRNTRFFHTSTVIKRSHDILLMAEASPNQMKIVMDCIQRFRISSGQRVSKSKSKIYVSKNVSQSLENQLEQINGLDVTQNLGTYLGVLVPHNKITEETFTPMLQKINAKLAGWKARTLSMAGRILLSKSVLSSMSVYTMNNLKLPNFQHLLPTPTILQLVAVGLSVGPDEQDVMCWAESSSRNYTSASAYLLLSKTVTPLDDASLNTIKLIWKLGKLVTNVERFRRHPAQNPTCPRRGMEPESLTHLFRDCAHSRMIWERLIPSHRNSDFFRDEAKVRTLKNLSRDYPMEHGIDEDVLFATTAWWLWKSRNA
ncbi:hypothetical protein V2J09_009693 [Rumex salicifolius]